MADLFDQAHVDAGLALLRADPGLTVYPGPDGVTPRTPDRPYVRVYATVERPAVALGNALRGASTEAVVRWWCHCVADSEPAAVAVAMRVRAALLDQRPVIAGRSCGLIRQAEARPPMRDETTGVQVMDLVQVYRLTTH